MTKADRSTAAVLRRVLKVLAEIRAERAVNLAVLAKRGRVDERTIKRDIRMLRTHFKAPILYNRRIGFYLGDAEWRLDDASSVRPRSR